MIASSERIIFRECLIESLFIRQNGIMVVFQFANCLKQKIALLNRAERSRRKIAHAIAGLGRKPPVPVIGDFN